MQTPAVDDRKFGWQFGIGLVVLSLLGLWRGWWNWLVIALAVLAMVHFILAWAAPTALSPINRAWTSLGYFLGKIVSPIVLALMFMLLIVPIATFMRLRRRDELLLRDRSGETFWVERLNTSIDAQSFRNQY